MKKGLFIILAVVVFLVMVCETGIEVNLSTVKLATSNIVSVESKLLGAKRTGFTMLKWWWAITKPEVGDGIIVQYSTNNTDWRDIDTISPITDTMTFKTTDTLYVKGGARFYYKLNYWNGQNIEPFDTIEVYILPLITYVKPDSDTINLRNLAETLTVTWRTIKNKKDELIKDYKVEVYRGKITTDPDSLLNLVNPIDSKEVSATAAESVLTCKFSTADTTKYPSLGIFTIKVAPKSPYT
ncbi:MAG: hypothetical protein ABIL05_00745, partial [candidate division WOR-3 bacterium]